MLSREQIDAIRTVGMRGTAAGRVLAMGLLRLPLENARHSDPGVREAALAWSSDATVAIALSTDRDARVRFAAALTLGRFPGEASTRALAQLARRTDNDTWTQTAILLAARGANAATLLTLLPAESPLRGALAQSVGARGVEAELVRVLQSLDEHSAEVLAGLGAGLRQSGGSLEELLRKPVAEPAKRLLAQANRTALDGKATPEARLRAVRLLSFGAGAARGGAARFLLSQPGGLIGREQRGLEGHSISLPNPFLKSQWLCVGPQGLDCFLKGLDLAAHLLAARRGFAVGAIAGA
jgi:hypothetical protein